MGNAYNIKHWVGTITDDPELRPGYESTPTFDPMFGFKNGRKERGKLESIKLQPRISQLNPYVSFEYLDAHITFFCYSNGCDRS